MCYFSTESYFTQTLKTLKEATYILLNFAAASYVDA